MTNQILDIGQKLIIPFVVAIFGCQGIWELIMFIVKRKCSKKDGLDKVIEELKEITARLDKIEARLEQVESKLEINTMAIKCVLYTDLDKWLNKMEIIGCWSSESKEKFDKLFSIYVNDLGDGLDAGTGLRARADSIPVDNTQFHEKMSRYNKHKIDVMNNGSEC